MASDLFLEQFQGVGGSSIFCSCGRTHTALLSPDHDDQEKQRLLSNGDSKSNILHHEDSCVMAKVIGRATFVVECPCKTLNWIENFLVENRKEVVELYKAADAWEAGELHKKRVHLAGLSGEIYKLDQPKGDRR